jgi:nucleoside-diphosphate-sugar epimerase
MSQALHVVLGAGQVGTLLAERLVARGHKVRVVRHSPAPARAAGVESVSADGRDGKAMAAAMRGAEVVYHCMNPAYDRWHEELLPLTRGIVDGARRAGSRLVVLDNLYMYGENTARMNEASPISPVSRKGALRAQAGEVMLEADARGDIHVAIGRASDWFGPVSERAVVFGDRFFKRIFAGKAAECFGDPDERHSYSYTPDVAEALLLLGARAAARGVWMLPVLPAETTRQVMARFERALGRPIPVTRVPLVLLRAVGIVSPMIREVAEMTYQWRQPFVVDDARFRTTFATHPTPWDEAVAATAAWAKQTYGARAAA